MRKRELSRKEGTYLPEIRAVRWECGLGRFDSLMKIPLCIGIDEESLDTICKADNLRYVKWTVRSSAYVPMIWLKILKLLARVVFSDHGSHFPANFLN